jgi:hypothetical protein
VKAAENACWHLANKSKTFGAENRHKSRHILNDDICFQSYICLLFFWKKMTKIMKEEEEEEESSVVGSTFVRLNFVARY